MIQNCKVGLYKLFKLFISLSQKIFNGFIMYYRLLTMAYCLILSGCITPSCVGEACSKVVLLNPTQSDQCLKLKNTDLKRSITIENRKPVPLDFFGNNGPVFVSPNSTRIVSGFLGQGCEKDSWTSINAGFN